MSNVEARPDEIECTHEGGVAARDGRVPVEVVTSWPAVGVPERRPVRRNASNRSPCRLRTSSPKCTIIRCAVEGPIPFTAPEARNVSICTRPCIGCGTIDAAMNWRP